MRDVGDLIRLLKEKNETINIDFFYTEEREKCPFCFLTKNFLIELAKTLPNTCLKLHSEGSSATVTHGVNLYPTILIGKKIPKINVIASALGIVPDIILISIESLVKIESIDKSRLSLTYFIKPSMTKILEQYKTIVNFICSIDGAKLTIINGQEFIDVAKEMNITHVPSLLVNGELVSVGFPDNEKLLAKLMSLKK